MAGIIIAFLIIVASLLPVPASAQDWGAYNRQQEDYARQEQMQREQWQMQQQRDEQLKDEAQQRYRQEQQSSYPHYPYAGM